jgi:hypothetical protein
VLSEQEELCLDIAGLEVDELLQEILFDISTAASL